MDLFSFHGRANRVDFWVVSIGLTFMQVVIGMLGGLAIASALRPTLTVEQTAIVSGVFTLLIQLAFLWPISAVAVRRSHDRNLSGWWYGVYQLAGIAVAIIVIVLEVLRIPETPVMTNALNTFDALHILAALALMILLGFLPGTPSANKYGLPPNSRHENYRSPPID